MSAAHTPGPWDLQMIDNNTGRIQHLCPMDEDGLSLLTVVEHDGKKFAAVYKDEDARLIAAAPDLLAALQALLDGPDGKTGSEYGMVIARGYAAIQKATGGQS